MHEREATMLKPGIYEQVVSDDLRKQIAEAQSTNDTREENVDKAEASRILAAYVEKLVRKSLDSFAGEGALGKQVGATNEVIRKLSEVIGTTDEDLANEVSVQKVEDPAKQLIAVRSKRNTIKTSANDLLWVRPDTSIARTSLFTGSSHEPQLYAELKKEIESADEILMLVSFVKWSGLRLILDQLRTFCSRKGRTLRVITTSYMGATDPKAINALAELPNAQVKISYDTTRTRLHAKAYVFRRNTGFTTAYVGSSNLSNPAMSSGLEWNVKISRADQPDTLNKIEATFETYWNSDEFETYDATDEQRDRLVSAINHERHKDADHAQTPTYSFDITPYTYQQSILDKLKAEREVGGHWRNLVVAATGTGKTVISAFDYKNFCQDYCNGRRANLLFVAHREEILTQSLSCFRGVLRDPNFGSLLVSNHRPERTDDYEHLFVSIQSFQSKQLKKYFDPDYYEFIVVDEIHHAAASSYQPLLEHFQPKVLLGLTATPERADGRSILPYFDNRIAAEIRLPEAIDRKLLCPFSYFGVSDSVDLSTLTWSRGGYEASELEGVYVLNQEIAKKRAGLIISSVYRYVTDVNSVHGLGFCVSKKHARFMAEQFNEKGIPSMALTADTPDDVRKSAREQIATGKIKFIFTVDLFNEGVDIPEIDTVLFLRPTQSLTVFLQQLGRGLRLADDKECLTVLDFIGRQNKRYDFACRLRAILEPSKEPLQKQVKDGFPSAPKGCYIQLEKVAQQHVLQNLQKALNTKNGLLDAIAVFTSETPLPLTLQNFVTYHHLDVRVIYKRTTFSRLKAKAGLAPELSDPEEENNRKALLRLCLADSRRWINFLLQVLNEKVVRREDEYSDLEKRMLSMLYVTFWPDLAESKGVPPKDAYECLDRIRANSRLVSEMTELLQLRLDSIDFVDEPVDLGFDCPLDLHCQYTRDQIMIAMDVEKPQSVREGVRYVKDKGVDVLLNTLNKSKKNYSPSTMYEDYSINEYLFHWQTQNKTTPESPTGRRYITQIDQTTKRKTRVALFAREYGNDEFGTEPFTYLGLATPLKHSGSRPMSIVWKLSRPIPGKFLPKSNKLAS